MKPAFIYFDLDNTLLDHSSAETHAQMDVHSRYPELQKVSINEWLDVYRRVNHHLWAKYQQGEIDRYQLQQQRFLNSMMELGLAVDRSEEIGREYMQRYRNSWQWVEGAKEALLHLSGMYRTGIITNGFKETQQKKFEVLGLDTFCEVMIISEEVGAMKPHPKVFDHATERAGVRRENILYVGDSYSSDVTGGKQAGWQTAWFTGLLQEDAHEGHADFTFTRFAELLDYLR